MHALNGNLLVLKAVKHSSFIPFLNNVLLVLNQEN